MARRQFSEFYRDTRSDHPRLFHPANGGESLPRRSDLLRGLVPRRHAMVESQIDVSLRDASFGAKPVARLPASGEKFASVGRALTIPNFKFRISNLRHAAVPPLLGEKDLTANDFVDEVAEAVSVGGEPVDDAFDFAAIGGFDAATAGVGQHFFGQATNDIAFAGE